MKKLLRRLAWVGVALSIGLFAATFPVESSFRSRAKLYQRVEVSPEAQLFGDVGTKIGSPQEMIIDDPKAVLPEKGEDGVTMVDERYLREKGIYPLQLKTVTFFSHWVRVGSGVAFAVCALILLALRRK